MKLEIKSQTPTVEDIAQVVADTKDFPFLTYIGPRTWRSFDGYYAAYEDNVFAGVLAVNRWRNIYLASANPKVWKIAGRVGFKEKHTWGSLPSKISRYV